MNEIKLYTDGACSGNPGPGGYGAVAVKAVNNNVLFKLSDGFRHTTNNRMEIFGAARALEVLWKKIWEEPFEKKTQEDFGETDIKVTVITDSSLVVNTMTAGWRRKANVDLWNRLDEAIRRLNALGIQVAFQWVKGHDTDKYNNMVDEMAVYASKNYTINADKEYEKIFPYVGIGFDRMVDFSSLEPVITEIRLKGVGTINERSVEVVLDNGTVVNILPLNGGFQQCGCTQRESSITVNIAWKYCKWLNGGKL